MITLTIASGDDNDQGILESQLYTLVHILSQFCHALEYIALMVGIIISRHFTKRDQPMNQVQNKTCCRKAILFLVCCILFVICMSPPVFMFAKSEDLILSYKVKECAATGYAVMSLLVHFCNLVVDVAMVHETSYVVDTWKNGCKNNVIDISELSKANSQTEPPAALSDHDHNGQSLCTTCVQEFKVMISGVCKQNSAEQESLEKLVHIFEKQVNNYEKCGNDVAIVQHIFQGWFVVHWLTYFVRITNDVTIAVKSLTSKEILINEPYHLSFFMTHLVFDSVTFLLLYVCGSLMNIYHKKYHRQLQSNQKKLFAAGDSECQLKMKNKCLSFLQNANLIPENPEYQFIPSFCGLSLPLDSAGYTVTLILALLAFIGNFMTNYLKV